MLQIKFDRLVQRITGWAGIIIFTICSFNIAAFECYSDEISILKFTEQRGKGFYYSGCVGQCVVLERGLSAESI